VTPAFRFGLGNLTLTQVIPIRFSFSYLSHIIVTPTETIGGWHITLDIGIWCIV
jgi:hypothetical protein